MKEYSGKLKEVKGGQSDEQPYRDVIEITGQRNVSKINLDIEVLWVGNGMGPLTTAPVDFTVFTIFSADLSTRL